MRNALQRSRIEAGLFVDGLQQVLADPVSHLDVSSFKNILILHLNYKTSRVPAFIGDSIRNLILFQASACAFAGFMDEAFYILLLFFPAWIFSKMFYQS
jgi:hypothetical protein